MLLYWLLLSHLILFHCCERVNAGDLVGILVHLALERLLLITGSKWILLTLNDICVLLLLRHVREWIHLLERRILLFYLVWKQLLIHLLALNTLNWICLNILLFKHTEWVSARDLRSCLVRHKLIHLSILDCRLLHCIKGKNILLWL